MYRRRFEDRSLAFRKQEGRIVMDGVLIITRVKRKHLGKYTCVANGQFVVKQTSAWVYIQSLSNCLTSEFVHSFLPFAPGKRYFTSTGIGQ